MRRKKARKKTPKTPKLTLAQAKESIRILSEALFDYTPSWDLRLELVEELARWIVIRRELEGRDA